MSCTECGKGPIFWLELAKTVLTLFLIRVKMSPYAKPFIELATVLDATP